MNKFKFCLYLLLFFGLPVNMNGQENVTIDSTNFKFYVDQSRQYYKEYRYRQALALLEQLYRYDSTSVQVNNQLGELFISFNNKPRAIYYLSKTLKQDSLNLFALISSGDIYLRNADPGIAQGFYFRVINYVDSNNYYAYRQIANAYYGMGEGMYGFALMYYNLAVNNNPYDIYSYSRMGNIYNVTNQYFKADSICNIGLKSDSLNSTLLNIKAYALYNMKLYLEAIHNFELVFQKPDTIPFNLKYAGLAYFNMDKYDKAQYFLERSIVYDSTDYDPFMVLGQICLQKNEYEKGLSYLKRAERLHFPPPHKTSEIFKIMADIYNQQNEWTKAIECFQQAYKLNPTDVTLVSKLAYQYDYLNQKEKAIPLYSKVIATADSSIYVDEVKLARKRLKKLKAGK